MLEFGQYLILRILQFGSSQSTNYQIAEPKKDEPTTGHQIVIAVLLRYHTNKLVLWNGSNTRGNVSSFGVVGRDVQAQVQSKWPRDAVLIV